MNRANQLDGEFRRGRFALEMSAALIVAAILRIVGLDAQPLTMDEVTEASIARMTPAEIVHYQDGFPPLYHLLLWTWSKAAPSAESGRWISVLAGVATVYAVGRSAQRVVNDRAGVVAAALLAASPLHVFLSQEMRAYALYYCFVAWSFRYLFDALASDRAGDWTRYVVVTTLGAYTHYYTGPAAAVMAAVAMQHCVARGSWRRCVAAFVALAACCWPVALLAPSDVSYQSTHGAQAPFAGVLVHTIYALFGGFSLGPSLRDLHVLPWRQAALLTAPWAAMFALAGGWLAALGWRELRERTLGSVVLLLALAPAPIIGALGTLAGVGFKVRYWGWLLFPLVVWLAAGAVRGWRGRPAGATRAALGAMIALQAFADVQRLVNPRYANEDVLAVAALIDRESSPETPVFVVADYLAPAVSYYLNGSAALYGRLPRRDPAMLPATESLSAERRRVFPETAAAMRGSRAFDDQAIDAWMAEAAEAADDAGRFWLVYSRAFHGDRDGRLLARLIEARWLERAGAFAGAELYRGQVPASRRGN